MPNLALAIGVLTGILDGGGAWSLHQSAATLRDVHPVQDRVWIVTQGGALGDVDPARMELRSLVLPEVPLLRFADTDEGTWVVDVEGRVWAVGPQGLEPTGFDADGWVGWFTRDGDSFSAVARRGGKRPVWIRQRRTRRVPPSGAWIVHDDHLWWSEDRGEFGGRWGRVGGPRRQRAATGFVPVGEKLWAYGGLEHIGLVQSWVFDAESGASIHATDWSCTDAPTEAPCDPIEWMGVRPDGRVDVWTRYAHRFVATPTPAGELDDWTYLGRLHARTSIGRPYSVGATSGLAAVRHAPDGAIWAATRSDGLFHVHGDREEATQFAGLPVDVADLRWVEGALWAMDDWVDMQVLEEGRWRTASFAPLDVPVEPGHLSLVGRTVDAQDGAVRWWQERGGSGRLFRQTATAIEELAPGPPIAAVLQPPGRSEVVLGRTRCDDLPDCSSFSRLNGWLPNDPIPHWLAGDGPPWHFGLLSSWWRLDADGTLTELDSLQYARSVLPTDGGGWWVVTWEGLHELDPQGKSIRTVSRTNELSALARDERGRIWAGGRQLSLLVDGKLEPIPGLPEVGRVELLAPLPDGRMAAATAAGVLLVDLPSD